MELRIKKIYNAGDIRSEYLEIFVNSDTNLKNFVILNSFNVKFNKSGKNYFYWLPDHKVDQGESVIVNTRNGINDLTSLSFYWNLEKPLWKEAPSSVYLIRIRDYEKFPDARR
ncbi:MAG: hypothetical protein ABIY50_10660, partial [Ignavibacteria bacterium]